LPVSFGDLPLPDDIAVRPAHAPQPYPRSIGDIEEDAVAPDNGCRTRPGRQLKTPGKAVGLRPARREIRLCCGAVQLWTAPLRPVVGEQGGDGADHPGNRPDHARQQLSPHRTRVSTRSVPHNAEAYHSRPTRTAD